MGYALQPKPSKLNPMNGLKRIFSQSGVVELIKSLLKVGLVSGIVYAVISYDLRKVVRLSIVGMGDAVSAIRGIATELVLWIGAVLFVLVIADFLYQRWEQMRDLRMTKQ